MFFNIKNAQTPIKIEAKKAKRGIFAFVLALSVMISAFGVNEGESDKTQCSSALLFYTAFKTSSYKDQKPN